jgi:hypothetical protein
MKTPRRNDPQPLPPAEGVNSMGLPGIEGMFTRMSALACASCGYTMLFAKHPEHLAD